MDNNATTAEENPPVQLVKGATVKAELGTVQVLEETLKGVGNTTRWTVNLDAVCGEDVNIRFVDYFGGRKINPDVMSFSFGPLSHSTWDAKPIGVREGPTLTIKSLKAATGRYQCIVTVDIVHGSRSTHPPRT